MAEVHGTCDDRFSGVRDALAAQLDGDELGASIAVDVDGETVVDIWGGWRDEGRTTPWTQDTIVNVWSTTKTVTTLAVLTLVEKGRLDVHAPVAEYWPEFAANGKADIRVKHLMSHTSGVAGWDPPFTVQDMYDWDSSVARLAAQAPWWEPGTASGYHAQNQGHLLGEVLRRVDGRSLKQYVAEELAGPTGADFQIGARPEDEGRIAPVVPPPPLPFDLAALDPASPMVRCFTGPVADASTANTPAWRAADMGALNGHSNARGVLDVMRVVSLGGEAGGVRLLSDKTLDQVFDVQSDGVDLVLGVPFRMGIGFGLSPSAAVPYLPDGRVAFWGGWGGSMIVMDLDRRVTTSYMMNRMAPGIVGSPRAEAYIDAVYAAL
ncbi:CubicO group peptidase, beta-lactamase class C family [Geodermatophilus amargosae]|uniref:CubicO group peptidase, beta-lactamase class C family n=1 Tax=Geodermatophilus amargosae TaxID=1296565 RepID=A0A1I7CUB3_9ACTN|nr:serine hydrolase domain-containing protein [Geodermatophilus amargosae]SFU03015.1 CubicO group peptidase, beta-lactamase class C family [Geodermatophilus amargosae]